MQYIYLSIVLFSLIGAIIVGLGCSRLSRVAAHSIAITGVAIAFVLSLFVLFNVTLQHAPVYNGSVYQWASLGGLSLEIGFLIDGLTALMITVVSFISLLVHIYTIGYMRDDPGYNRFFSYISMFTFAMLMLVMSNNFLQLFFGWEAVGLASYLLIGFWFKRPTATAAGLKAFLINRVGDFGFILGIAAIFAVSGSLDYQTVFQQAPVIAELNVVGLGDGSGSMLTLICIFLFIGAMGKSAQVPLHIWLPDSMEGPTPISALIHAATMVTAGVFMVARMSPLFEYSETALSFILVIGALTALLMGMVGIVQHDIKRVIAYSTLSQLGYMVVALGASAYSAAIFHLMTHAFFKALLFLAAGSVIIALHHEQDMRRMGGLRKLMPVTYWTCLIGALALIGFPGLSGFYSKDMIIEVVGHSKLWGAGVAEFCVVVGVFVTALYTFRMIFLTFHGQPRFDAHTAAQIKESPHVVTIPLILLAIPSVLVGALTVKPLLFGDLLRNALVVFNIHNTLLKAHPEFHGVISYTFHSLQSPALYLAAAGVFTAWWLYIKQPQWPAKIKTALLPLHHILRRKYWVDEIYQNGIAAGSRALADRLWRFGDAFIIDGIIINGSARLITRGADRLRNVQSGYLFHYAFAMIVGLLLLLGWMYLR
ncbi:MAG: NADH-quinone oxidoreductase subunit L [Gammaproteobacteria bacterium]|nr:NADH-quinone oxidoreductase subunit L [Gammaproteobacteria bacterium]